jgi:hypothetical protein
MLEVIERLLQKAGYTFHKGEAEDRPELGINAHWFCWAAAGTDIESSRAHARIDLAMADALEHWFANTHIMHTWHLQNLAETGPVEEPKYGEPPYESLMAYTLSYSHWSTAQDARECLAKHKVVPRE